MRKNSKGIQLTQSGLVLEGFYQTLSPPFAQLVFTSIISHLLNDDWQLISNCEDEILAIILDLISSIMMWFRLDPKMLTYEANVQTRRNTQRGKFLFKYEIVSFHFRKAWRLQEYTTHMQLLHVLSRRLLCHALGNNVCYPLVFIG